MDDRNEEAREMVRPNNASATNVELLITIAEQALKVRQLQKRFFKGERDVMPAAKAAERELDRRLDQLNSKQQDLL